MCLGASEKFTFGKEAINQTANTWGWVIDRCGSAGGGPVGNPGIGGMIALPAGARVLGH